MGELKGIITYHTEEYGNIRVKLAEVLDSRGITRNRLATLTGAKYAIIDRYYKAEQIEIYLRKSAMYSTAKSRTFSNTPPQNHKIPPTRRDFIFDPAKQPYTLTLIRHASRATFPHWGEGADTGTCLTAQ